METLICKECNKNLFSWRSFSHHIRKCHNGKIYYDKWIKTLNEGKCKNCGDETKFNSVKIGYFLTCGKNSCIQILKEKTKIENNLKRYNVENVFQTTFVKNKSKCTKKKRYGNENYTNREKAKKTSLTHFDVEQPLKSIEIRNKIKITNQKLYNVDHPWQNLDIRKKGENTIAKNFGVSNPRKTDKFKEKAKQTKKERYGNENYINLEKRKKTCLEKYGVDSIFKVPEIQLRMFKSGLKIKQYKNTNLFYQGTYELDFLNTFYDIIHIEKGPIIQYKLNEISHEYFSDFYISKLNLVIEIKSSYFAKKDNYQIAAKRIATFNAGYNYIMILNKHYTEFKQLLIN